MSWPALETVGAFRYNRKPMEYLLFPHGTHLLQRPRERVAVMRASVDWMNFWLRGVDPGSEQGDRAERWRRMRADWEAVQAEERGSANGGQNRPASKRAVTEAMTILLLLRRRGSRV